MGGAGEVETNFSGMLEGLGEQRSSRSYIVFRAARLGTDTLEFYL